MRAERIGLGFELPGAAGLGNLSNSCSREKSVKCFRICRTRGDSIPDLLVVSGWLFATLLEDEVKATTNERPREGRPSLRERSVRKARPDSPSTFGGLTDALPDPNLLRGSALYVVRGRCQGTLRS
jgi:hypothetical protein